MAHLYPGKVYVGQLGHPVVLSYSRDSSVVRAQNLESKGHGFESPQERRKNFLLKSQLSVLTRISVSVPPPCYPSST